MNVAAYLGKDKNGDPVYGGWVDVEQSDVDDYVANLEPDEIQHLLPGGGASGIGKVGKGWLAVEVRIDPKRAEMQVTECIERVRGSKVSPKFKGRISDGVMWDTSISEEIIINLLEQILDMIRRGVHKRE